MKHLFFCLIIFFSFSSCNQDEWKDKVAKGISEVGSPIIAKTFSCENEVKIKEDLYKKILESKLLKKDSSRTKGIGSALCITVVNTVVPQLVSFGTQKLPEDWKCTGENIEEAGKFLAKQICSKIPY